ncbi:MAG: YegP family protein [Eubacteriales bacterium]
MYVDKAGEYRFRLKAGNGEIIAVGEGYQAKAGCVNGIESIKKNVDGAKIVEIE